MKKQYEIGSKAYPRDNSWIYDAATGEPKLLAATIKSEPKLVTIVSLPYQLVPPDLFSSGSTREFVTVYHEGRCYVCLNNFSDEIYKWG